MHQFRGIESNRHPSAAPGCTAAVEQTPPKRACQVCRGSNSVQSNADHPGGCAAHAWQHNPCTMSCCPTGAAHRLAQSTMRRWRDSPGAGPADNSFDKNR